MEVFRIAREKHCRDLSGEGARLFGGRWNKKGIGLVYTSQQASLAALEVLAHVSSPTLPSGLKLVTIVVPDNVSQEVIEVSQLPSGWRNYPAPNLLAEIGTKWILSQKSLLLKVPSVLIETEKNILINPLHQEINKVKIVLVSDFNFDGRLIK